jgi:hypothetical protein
MKAVLSEGLKLRKRAWSLLRLIIPLRFILKRKVHLYCLGTAKSGTHSIASIFEPYLRIDHEASSREMITKILDYYKGIIGEKEIENYLLERDNKSRLEMDSSQLNHFFAGIYAKLFPNARFILSIRDPYSWLDSFINHQLYYTNTHPTWIKLRDFRFKAESVKHGEEESALKVRMLYSLDGYLSYWARHNSKVLNEVPENRLMLVRTDEISKMTDEMLNFAGISVRKNKKAASHKFKAKVKYDVLEKIDMDYLDKKVKAHCGDLMKRFFPEIQSYKDVSVSNYQ